MGAIRSFPGLTELNTFLQGGVIGGNAPPLQNAQLVGGGARLAVFGLHGLTLEFLSPTVQTVTFSDPSGLGLSYNEILQQIRSAFGGPGVVSPSFFSKRLLLIESFPSLGVTLDSSGTANSIFGFSTSNDTSGAVVNSNSIPPYFISLRQDQNGSYVLTLEGEDVLPIRSGNILWLRADRGVSETGGLVDGWDDISGSNNNAVQATGVDRPTWSATSGPNNLPGITFDQANTEHLDIPSLVSSSNDYTVFIVTDYTSFSATYQNFISCKDSGGQDFNFSLLNNTNLGMADAASWRDTGAEGLLGDQWIEWHLDSTATKLSCFRDGSLVGTDTYSGSRDIASDVTIGDRHDTAGTQDIGATISEIIIYDRVLSASELKKVRAYLTARYSLWFDPKSVAGLLFWLRSDNVIEIPIVEVLADGDCESTTGWTGDTDSVLSVETASPDSDNAIRITAVTPLAGAQTPSMSQSVMVIGKEYRITGRARSDGTHLPKVGTKGTGVFWTGTNSTSWQDFDVTFTADHAEIELLFTTTDPGVGEYVEFNTLSLKRTTSDISQLTDLSGNGNHFVNGNPPERPSYIISGSYPLLRFDAANNQQLQGPTGLALGLSAEFNWFTICTTSAAGSGGCTGAKAGPPRFYLQRDRASYTNLNILTYTVDDSMSVRQWLHDGTNFIHRRDGVQLASAVIAFNSGSTAPTAIGQSGSDYLGGDVEELFAYTRPGSGLTIEEQESLETYAADTTRYLRAAA